LAYKLLANSTIPLGSSSGDNSMYTQPDSEVPRRRFWDIIKDTY
jgi:hypothetical protein